VLQLDLYRSERTPATRAPVVVWVHGGGFVGGDRSHMAPYAAEFARRGYLTASISYRLTTRADLSRAGYGWALAAAQHDAQAAVRWFRRRAVALGADPRRIHVGGYSAGAVTALRVGERADDPGRSGNPGLSSRVASAISIAGGGHLGSIDRGDAPALLLHGTRDALVPFSWARDTLAAYRRAGVRAQLVSFLGVGHNIASSERDRVIPIVARWLRAP
jgi:acetyl esterase/lipase